MKSYKDLMEGIKKWSDVKDKNAKKESSKFLKALDKGQVLGYSAVHDEFSIFDSEKEFKSALSDKKMKWMKVENKVDFNFINSQSKLQEAFKFDSAVKNGFLDKFDKKWYDMLTKKGYEIEEFNLLSKGYEITVSKGGNKQVFLDRKSPSKVLQTAAEKVK